MDCGRQKHQNQATDEENHHHAQVQPHPTKTNRRDDSAHETHRRIGDFKNRFGNHREPTRRPELAREGLCHFNDDAHQQQQHE